jgi:hypothetical protein
MKISDPITGFRLPRTMLATVDSLCAKQDLTRSRVFRRSVTEYLKSQNAIATDMKPPEPQRSWPTELYSNVSAERNPINKVPKRPLKPFKQFLPESFRGARHGRASGNALNEAIRESNDRDITDATSVIIGSELSLSERKSLIDGFVNYIEEMCEAGRSIMAIAVALG